MKSDVWGVPIPGQPGASDQSGWWLGKSGILWALVSTTLALPEACATRHLRLLNWYSPPQITPLAHLQALGVYPSTDKRQGTENAIGVDTSTAHGGRSTTINAKKPR